MGASFSFELLKLRKRPSTWVLGGILVAVVGLFGYLFGYLLMAGTGGSPVGAERFLTTLYPENVVAGVLGILSSLGGVIALILGSLAVGGEYGWDTLKTVLTQRPNRSRVFVGKLLALAAALAAFVLASFAIGAAGSYVIAGLEDAPVVWPSVGELLRGAGAAWLILVAWATVGAFFATLLRGTALAVGLGLVYALVLENLITGLSFVSETVEKVRLGLLGKNSSDLGLSFEGAQGAAGVDPTRAALVLVAYAAVALALSLLLFRRDVV